MWLEALGIGNTHTPVIVGPPPKDKHCHGGWGVGRRTDKGHTKPRCKETMVCEVMKALLGGMLPLGPKDTGQKKGHR